MVRIKHRYILFDILYPSTTTSPAPAQSSSSPQPPAPGTSTVILRVPRAHYSLVWASLTFMDTLPGPQRGAAPPVRCVARVVRVSGTIRKSEEEVLRRARRDIVRAKLEGREDEDGDVVLEGLLDQNNGKRPVQLASLRAQEEEEGVIDFDYEQDMEDSSD
ncbi:RNA-binding protein pop5 [Exophiala oligosperma]